MTTYIATAIDDKKTTLQYRTHSMVDALDWCLAHINHHRPRVWIEGHSTPIWAPDSRLLEKLRCVPHRPYRRASV